MKNISKTLLVLILSFMSAVTYAKDSLPPLFHCPSVDAIQAGGVGTGVIFLDGAWYAGRRQMKYDTRRKWTFIMGKIAAVDSTDAYNKGRTGLETLTYLFGPEPNGARHWFCMYVTAEGYPTITVTPAIAPIPAIKMLREVS